MAITITPHEQRQLIDALNDNYERTKKEHVDIRLDKLPKEQQEAPIEKLFEKEAGNQEFQDTVEKLRDQEGDEITESILKHYVNFGGYRGDEGTEENAFFSLKAPKTLMATIYTSYWKKGKDQYKDVQSSDDIIEKMSPEERSWFFSKLNFKAFWKEGVKEGDIALYGEVPIKTKTFHATFKMPEFLEQAAKILDRPSKEGAVDKEKLIENLVEVLDEKCKAEAAYHDDPESYGDEASYAKDDVKHKKLKDIIKDIDEENVLRYIEKLQARGVTADEIKEMLADTADEEFNDSHYNVSNSIGMTSLSSETELYLDNRDDWVDDTADIKWPYPGDFDANLALLDKEECEEIRKQMHEGTPRFSWDGASQQYTLDSVTVYLSDNRSVHLVVNEKKFIMAASRMLKDLMLKPPRKKKVELGASVEKLRFTPDLEAAIMQLPVFKLLEEWDRFPATGSVMRKAMPKVSGRFPALTKVLKKT